MIPKIHYRFVINAQITILTWEEISARRANTITCFHLSHSVSQYFFVCKF